MNYQKELDKLIVKLEKEESCADTFTAQLLCTLQQLCVGIFESVFPDYGFLL